MMADIAVPPRETEWQAIVRLQVELALRLKQAKDLRPVRRR